MTLTHCSRKSWFRFLSFLLILQIFLSDLPVYAARDLFLRENADSSIPLLTSFGSEDSDAELRRQEFSRQMNIAFIREHLTETGFGATSKGRVEPKPGLKDRATKWQAREKGIFFGLLSSALGALAVISAENVLRSETNVIALLFSASIIIDLFLHLTNFLFEQNKSSVPARQYLGVGVLLAALSLSGAAIWFGWFGYFLLGVYFVAKPAMIINKIIKRIPPALSQKGRWGIATHPMIVQPFGLLSIPYFGPIFTLLSMALAPIFAAVIERMLSVKRFGKMHWLGAGITLSALVLSRHNQLSSLTSLPVIFVVLYGVTQAVARIILKYIQTDLPKMSPTEQVRIAYATSTWPFALGFLIQLLIQGKIFTGGLTGIFSELLQPLNSTVGVVTPLVISWALIRMSSRLTEFRTVKYTDSSTTSFLRSTSAVFGFVFGAVLMGDFSRMATDFIQLIASVLTAFGVWLFVRSPARSVAKSLAAKSKNKKLSEDEAYKRFSELGDAITHYLYLRHRRQNPSEEKKRLLNIRIRLDSVMYLADFEHGINHKIMYESISSFLRSFPVNFRDHGFLAWTLGGPYGIEQWMRLPEVYSDSENKGEVISKKAPLLYSKLNLARYSVPHMKLRPYLKRIRLQEDLVGRLRQRMAHEEFSYRLSREERSYLERLLSDNFWLESPEQFASNTGFDQVSFLTYLLYYLEDKSHVWNRGNALSNLARDSKEKLLFDIPSAQSALSAEFRSLARAVNRFFPYRTLKRKNREAILARYTPDIVRGEILKQRGRVKGDVPFRVEKFHVELLNIVRQAEREASGKELSQLVYHVPLRLDDQEYAVLFTPYRKDSVDQFSEFRGNVVWWTVEKVGKNPWIFALVPWPAYRENLFVSRVKGHYENAPLADGIHREGDSPETEYTLSTIAPDLRRKTRDLIREEIGTGKRILTIGPGRGLLEQELARDGYEVSTMEISQSLSEKLKSFGNLSVYTGDAQHLERVLPISIASDETKKFDAIVLSESMGYFDGEELFQKLGAYLKHKGRIILTTYSDLSDKPIWGYRFTPFKEIEHWLSEAGWEIRRRAFYRLDENWINMPVSIQEVDREDASDIYLISAQMSSFARKLNQPESPVSFSIRQATIRKLLSEHPEFREELDRDIGALLEIARILAGRLEHSDLEDGFQRDLIPPVLELDRDEGKKLHDLSKGWSIRMVGVDGHYDMSLVYSSRADGKEKSTVIAIAKAQPLLPSVAGDSVAGDFSADVLGLNEELSVELLDAPTRSSAITVQQLETKILHMLDKFFVFGDRVIPGNLTGITFENLLVSIAVNYVRPGVYRFRVTATNPLESDMPDAERLPIMDGFFRNIHASNGFGIAGVSQKFGTTVLVTRNQSAAFKALVSMPLSLREKIMPRVRSIVVVWPGQADEARKYALRLAAELNVEWGEVYFSGDLGLLKEEIIQNLLRQEMFHFGAKEDLPPALRYLHSGDMPAVAEWLIWMADRDHSVRTAA